MKEEYWRTALENRLRKSHGDAFQQFFHEVMGAVHGDDYEPVTAHGRLGDGGIDGILGNSIFQCYGAKNGSITDISYVRRKIREDFATARGHRPSMTEWSFVHNHWDAIPEPIAAELDALRSADGNGGVKIGHFGQQSFMKKVMEMSGSDRDRLLSLYALSEVDRETLPSQVTELIDAIMGHIDGPLDPSDMPTKPVPMEKLDFNDIPNHWRMTLRSFFAHTAVAKQCLGRHSDPTANGTVGAFLRRHYVSAREEGANPGQILHNIRVMLNGFVARPGDSSFEAAVLTMMAAAFEDCIIFEDEPKVATWEPADDPA